MHKANDCLTTTKKAKTFSDIPPKKKNQFVKKNIEHSIYTNYKRCALMAIRQKPFNLPTDKPLHSCVQFAPIIFVLSSQTKEAHSLIT